MQNLISTRESVSSEMHSHAIGNNFHSTKVFIYNGGLGHGDLIDRSIPSYVGPILNQTEKGSCLRYAVVTFNQHVCFYQTNVVW